jgi:hypothetical protein
MMKKIHDFSGVIASGRGALARSKTGQRTVPSEYRIADF